MPGQHVTRAVQLAQLIAKQAPIGVQATLLDCALKLGAICQAPPHLHPTHAPERAGDVRHSVADISLARSLLGYEPVCSFEEGLAETVEWSRHEADAAGT